MSVVSDDCTYTRVEKFSSLLRSYRSTSFGSYCLVTSPLATNTVVAVLTEVKKNKKPN